MPNTEVTPKATVQVQTTFYIEPFNPKTMNWNRWLQRLEGAFKIFQIEDKLRVPYLLHYIGNESFEIISDKIAPEDPYDKKFTELTEKLEQFYSPAPLEIAENFRFHQRKQKDEETLQEFIVALQKLSIHCNFSTYLKTALRNQFVFGISNRRIQSRLLETSELDFDKAVKIATSMELSEKDVNQLQGGRNTKFGEQRRKVTVNDLSPADIQGYLYQRLRFKHTQNVHWEKRWFVLLGSCLYGYKNKEDPRAAFLIFLSDFTVSLASEVKSRSNAFKVYHTGTVFYFSAEDSDTLQSWVDLIRSACLHHDTVSKIYDGSLFSETDDSDTEKPKLNQTEKTDSLKKFGSLKKFSLKKPPTEATHTGSTSLDRKWFFNKSSTNTKNNSVPVPTAHFRSYRKIRNEPTHASVRTGNFTSHVPMFGPSNLTQSQNISVPNLTVEHIVRTPIIDPSKNKPKPLNYVHASNPSLCNVGEHTSNSKNSSKERHEYKRGHDNLAGFVTLEELMNRQTEESRKNPHNEFEQMQINLNMIKPDVVYGEVPIRSKPQTNTSEDNPQSFSVPLLTRSSSHSDKHESSSSCFGKRLGSLKKNQKGDSPEGKMATYPKTVKGLESKSNRSLPRMLKMKDMSRECEEYSLSNLHFSSDKNLSIGFRKKSYEMIYCPETVNEIQFAQNRMLDDTTPKKSGKVKRQTSFGSSEKKSSKSLPGFTSKVGDSSRGKLKSATQYTPMSLPMSSDNKSTPTFAFELNLDEKHSRSTGKLTKIFTGKSDKKEKTFLGSPKLHRAIFRKQHSEPDGGWISSPAQSLCLSPSASSLEQSPPIPPQPFPMPIRPHADYPGLEYPPVFEPETYSLADPQSSLNLIRSKQKKESKENVDNQSNTSNQ